MSDKHFKKSENICRCTSDDIYVVNWKDKRDVLMISPEFPHEMIEINIAKVVKKKSVSVIKYNKNVSGINQMSSYQGRI